MGKIFSVKTTDLQDLRRHLKLTHRKICPKSSNLFSDFPSHVMFGQLSASPCLRIHFFLRKKFHFLLNFCSNFVVQIFSDFLSHVMFAQLRPPLVWEFPFAQTRGNILTHNGNAGNLWKADSPVCVQESFLPDPGVSGVRSMGPGLSNYVHTRPL